MDDGSSDRTAEVVKDSPARLICNPGNRGKGYAVRNGMLSARGQWILYTDADLSTPIEEADKLYTRRAPRRRGIAIGSRALDRSLVTVHQSAFREYSGRGFNVVMRALTGLAFNDTQCGFKLFDAQAAQAVFSRQLLDGFSFDVEDLYIAKKCGIRAVEVPVRWANVEGSKVSIATGIRSFGDLVRIRRNGIAGRYN